MTGGRSTLKEMKTHSRLKPGRPEKFFEFREFREFTKD
jgi:hypothetical protein